MTRTLAALAAALIATGARAQTPPAAAPPSLPTPAPSDSPTPPAATTAPAAEPRKDAPKKDEKKPKGTFAVGEKSQVSIQGRAWGEVNNVRAAARAGGTGTILPRTRLSSNSSYLRVRGERDLGEGWTGIAQIEAEFGLEGENGLPFGSTRNTGAGLSSPFGTLILGRWDSPMKQTTLGLDPFGGTGIFGYYNIFGQQFVKTGSSGSNRWDRRLNNGAFYTSPTVQGFTVLAAGSLGESPTGGAGTLHVTPYTASGAVHFKSGPLYVGVAYEYRHDCGNPDQDAPGGPSCSTAALGGDSQPRGADQGLRAGFGYTVKQTFTKLGLAYEHIDLKATAIGTAPEKTIQRDAYFATVTQGLLSDRHQLILNYGLATRATGHGALTTYASTGAQYVTGAYRFWLDKDLDLYAAFTQILNEKNATYRIGSGGPQSGGSGLSVPIGATVSGYGAGVRYIF